ncbi:MAG: putative methyltransferase [Bacteroidetes bacterium]|nr:MAG: putative methyltransferase [Bacteroidota bacterium]
MSKGVLYLIPVPLGEESLPQQVLPAQVTEVINKVSEFITEDARSARRFLKKAGYNKSLNELVMHSIGKHAAEDRSAYLAAAEKGMDIGLLSEAGCPGVADPGSDIVRMAHEKNIRVVPLTGPSSILLALMASGFNGQSFCFHGYLPIDKHDRSRKIKNMERDAREKKQTQIFIETPFRNEQLFSELVQNCDASTLLCIACDISLPAEFIQTHKIGYWKNTKPALHKRPAVFLIG